MGLSDVPEARTEPLTVRNESRGHFTREDFAVTLTCALWKSFLYISPELFSLRSSLEPYLSAALQVAEEQLRSH